MDDLRNYIGGQFVAHSSSQWLDNLEGARLTESALSQVTVPQVTMPRDRSLTRVQGHEIRGPVEIDVGDDEPARTRRACDLKGRLQNS